MLCQLSYTHREGGILWIARMFASTLRSGIALEGPPGPEMDVCAGHPELLGGRRPPGSKNTVALDDAPNLARRHRRPALGRGPIGPLVPVPIFPALEYLDDLGALVRREVVERLQQVLGRTAQVFGCPAHVAGVRERPSSGQAPPREARPQRAACPRCSPDAGVPDHLAGGHRVAYSRETLARLEGVEPPTRSLEGCRSIQLSYRRFGFLV